MTKPLPVGSIIKLKKIPSMREFYLIIQEILDEDKIGHFSVIDTKLDTKNASEEQLFFKEIDSPIFVKKIFCRQTKDQFFNFLMP